MTKLQQKTELSNSKMLFVSHSDLPVVKPHYYVMNAVIDEGFVRVDCIDENAIGQDSFPLIKHIHVKVLTAYIEDNGLNEYCMDYMQGGEAIQDAGTLCSPLQYLTENLDEVVTAFLNRKVVCNG